MSLVVLDFSHCSQHRKSFPTIKDYTPFNSFVKSFENLHLEGERQKNGDSRVLSPNPPVLSSTLSYSYTTLPRFSIKGRPDISEPRWAFARLVESEVLASPSPVFQTGASLFQLTFLKF